jgi:aconitate hydratase
MGVLPLQFRAGESSRSLGLRGEETYSIRGLVGRDAVPDEVTVRAEVNGTTQEFVMIVRIDTPSEAEYFRHGGILQYVLRQLVAG